MDIATISGIIIIVTAVVTAIIAGGDLTLFFDLPSMMVVGGGIIGATFIKWPIDTLKLLFVYVGKALFFTPHDPRDTIEKIGVLAEDGPQGIRVCPGKSSH